jgi:hypothetical protein
MSSIRLLLALWIVAAVQAGQGAAQAIPIDSGTKVRVTDTLAVPVRPVTGTFMGQRGDTLLVRVRVPDASGAGPWQERLVAVPATRIRLEVSRGRVRRLGRPALIGAAAGAVLGVAVALVEGGDPPDCWLLCYSAEEKVLLYGAGLGMTGAGVGVVVGLLSPVDRWEAVTPPRVTRGVASRPGGFGLGVRARF